MSSNSTDSNAFLPGSFREIEYKIHLVGQSISLLIYLILYILSFVVLFGRQVPKSMLAAILPSCGTSSSSKFKPLPFLSCVVILSINILLFLRAVVRVMVLVDGGVALSTMRSTPEFPQIGLAIEALGFALLMCLYEGLLVLWMQSLQNFSSRSTNGRASCDAVTYYTTVVICFIISLVSAVSIGIAAAFYFGLQGLYNPALHNLVVNFTVVPIYIVCSAILCLIIMIVGIRVIVKLTKNGGKGSAESQVISVPVKVLVTKLSIALVSIPLANFIRLLGVGFFAANIPYFSTVQSGYVAVGIPDFISCGAVLLCFWPYKIGMCTCLSAKQVENDSSEHRKSTGPNSLLQALLEPIQFQLKRRNSEGMPTTPSPAATVHNLDDSTVTTPTSEVNDSARTPTISLSSESA